MEPTNGSGNGFSPLFGNLGDVSQNGHKVCDRRTGELIALRTAFATTLAVLKVAGLNQVSKEIAQGISEGQAIVEPGLFVKARTTGPRSVVRFRSFSDAMGKIVERLRNN